MEFVFQNHSTFEVVSDVKSQLKVFEQIDEVERKHREAREREMLMKVAKVLVFFNLNNIDF